MWTKAYNMRNCKYIIHAVPPIWCGGQSHETFYLERAMRQALKVANQLNAQTLAIPSLGVGVFGIPKQVAADVYFDAIRSFFQNNPQTSIKSVKFVDINPEMIQILQNKLDQIQLFESKATSYTMLPKSKPMNTINVQWYWQEDNGHFIPYDPDQNKQIESAYLEGKQEVMIPQVNSDRIYKVIFKEMIQINVQTNYKRKVKREEKSLQLSSTIPTTVQSSNNNNKSTNQSQSTITPQTIQLTIIGLEEDVKNANEELKKITKIRRFYF
jgi:hypothetical protein